MRKTFKKEPKMFRSCANKFKYNLGVQHDISEVIDICFSEDMVNKASDLKANRDKLTLIYRPWKCLKGERLADPSTLKPPNLEVTKKS